MVAIHYARRRSVGIAASTVAVESKGVMPGVLAVEEGVNHVKTRIPWTERPASTATGLRLAKQGVLRAGMGALGVVRGRWVVQRISM